jgi:hypothetical protein
MKLRTFVLWGMVVSLVFCGLANGEELPAAEQKSSTISPGKAFLFSLLMPGSGQLYAGEKRGIAFLALEAVVWPAYFIWRQKGKDVEKDYQEFADTHWEFDHYKVWRDYIGTTDDRLSHSYEEASQQQKYEMIGKYDQFIFGWDDSEPSLRELQNQGRLEEYPPDSLKNVCSSNRKEYMDMRYDSNKYLKRAGWCVGALLANHILSAIDAAHCAQLKRKGLSLEKRVRVRMAVRFEGEEAVPMLCLSKRF